MGSTRRAIQGSGVGGGCYEDLWTVEPDERITIHVFFFVVWGEARPLRYHVT